MKTVCTIITPDYVAYAQALRESIVNSLPKESDSELYVFIAVPRKEVTNDLPTVHGMYYIFIEDLLEDKEGRQIYDNYFKKDVHAFRWAMKPVLIKYLMRKTGRDKIIFVDGDIFFYSDFSFIYDRLNDASVLLTPHWRSRDPHLDPSNFQDMLNQGIYNAGFIAVHARALPALDWWAKVCAYKCAIEPSKGFFGDQTYLNLMHVYFEGVEILKHQGCNVANWNRHECKRVKSENDEVLINGRYPVVFIHFTGSTIRGIVRGNDGLLDKYVQTYADTLKKYNPRFDIIQQALKPRKKITLTERVSKYLREKLK